MYRLFLLCGVAALATPALAATVDADAPHAPETEAADPYHYQAGADIVVTAAVHRDLGSALTGTSIVTGVELTKDLRPTIGDTLIHQPGVSSTSFGPNASRPILRGFQGDRVRVLTDGIGSFDVSNTSVDHPVVINTLTADRIEVLRGPSALLFGSSAVGGVINVIDNRIPRAVPDESIHLEGLATYGSAADERSVSGVVEAPVAGKIVVHFDGSYSKTGDLETGGPILTPALRAEAAASPDPAIRALADLSGRLPNSAGRSWDVAGGAALITDNGNLGFSVSRYGNLYGIPIRYSLDPSIEAEQVRIDAHQTRADFRGEIDPAGGFLKSIRFRGGYADYNHSEIDADGAVGTTFLSQGWEGRLELLQADRGPWSGAFGGQFVLRNLNIIGDEKFLPKSETQQYGVFTLQQIDLGALKAEAGLRYERSLLSAVADADLGNPALRRTFDALSGSIGASYEVVKGWRLGLNLSRSARAPSAEELFANGPHAGTQAFEIGNPDFKTEKSWGVEGTLRGRGDRYTFDVSAYHTWFSDYIYERQTGAIEDDLPVFQQSQADARYYGFEVEGSYRFARIGTFDLIADGLADYVHATILDSGPVPRIPPLRVLGGIEARDQRIQARAEVERTMGQDRLSPFETETPGFTLVNASLAFSPFGRHNPTSIVLSANNLFDVVARRHASFLKDYAPLAGRDLRVTVRVSF